MRKLLAANFMRLRQDKVFWLAVVVMLACSVLIMYNGCRQAAMDEMSEYPFKLEEFYFNLAPVVGLFCAVFCSLFLGAEYSEGTIRNKLVVGHSRAGVYAANLVTCAAATLAFVLAWLLGGLVGIPALGPWQLGTAGLLVYILLAVLFSIALAAIFTFVGMSFSGRAVGTVAAMLLYLGLLILASMLYNRLCEPEMYSGVIITAEGMEMGEPKPNPFYISGSLRQLYQFIVDFLPTGQGILMANLELAHPLRMALSSLAIIAATTLGGIALFRKKDLK